MSRATRLALIGTAGLLAVIVAAEWLDGESRIAQIGAAPQTVREAARRAAPAGETGASPEQIDNWVRIALARPLMTSSRRPAPASATAGVALTGGLPRLAGTVMRDDGGTAIFARGDTGQSLIVREGATVGPYRIEKITADSVTVDGPDGKQTLRPRFGEQRGPVFPQNQFMPGTVPMPGALPPMPGVPQPPQNDRDSE